MVDVDRMRADLLTARKARDKVAETAINRALGAFENAEGASGGGPGQPAGDARRAD